MAEKIKVLHVVVDMGHGGYENYLMNVFRHIDRNKYEFNFLVFKGRECYFEKEIISLGGKVFHCTYSDDFKYHKARKQLKEIIENNHFDILHCHAHYYSHLFLKMFSKKIKTVILHSHNSSREHGAKGTIVYFLSKYASRKKYHNLACSEVSGKFFYGKKGKYELCPNCIETEEFAYDEKAREELRDQYKIDNDTLVLGHIGRFAPIKNHAFLLKLARQLIDEKYDFKLCLCGAGKLYNKIYEEVTSDEKLNKNVIFLKPGDVRKHYSMFDMLLLPSFSEGFPLTLLESQASGCYAIASDTITDEVKLSDIVRYESIKEPSEIGRAHV